MKARLVVLVWTAACILGRAQPVVVNPDGSGDYVDLQVALDSEPEGSAFVVHGTHQFITINKSAQILGVAGAEIKGVHGSDPEGFVVKIDADPTDDVVLTGLTICGFEPLYVSWNGIQVDSVGSLTLDQCTVAGGATVDGDCSQNPFHGHGILDLSGGALTVSRSSIHGGDGAWISDGDCCLFDLEGSPGGVGISATGSILLIDSVVQGGAGGDVVWSCPAGPPITLDAGDGGHAVLGDVYQSSSTMIPGQGGHFLYNGFDWGIGTDGADGLPVVGHVSDLPDQLLLSPTGIGSGFDLQVTGFPPSTSVLVLVGFGAIDPISLGGRGLWFLQRLLFVLPLPVDSMGLARLQGTIPTDVRLIGDTLRFQAVNATTLTEPAVLVIDAG